ncbi:MAG: copper-binding protein plastocyanin/azurin family [Cyanobacteria bacterium RYN_339]|nr:copper-binding protein plastocyanin/azurin family [Cyanobacteria bacterium RYN_339]
MLAARIVVLLAACLLLGCPQPNKTAAKPSAKPSPTDTPRPPTPTPGPTELAVDDATIHIKNHAFQPAVIHVKQGGTVTWLNDDADPHTATPTLGASFSGTERIDANSSSGKVTFKTAGEQSYKCDYHPGETGKIVVVPVP